LAALLLDVLLIGQDWNSMSLAINFFSTIFSTSSSLIPLNGIVFEQFARVLFEPDFRFK